MRHHFLIVIGLLAGGPAVTLAQEFQLRGAVVDFAGGVLVGAEVSVAGSDTESRTASTDQRGQFLVGALKPGRYHVTVESPGFAPFATSVDLREPLTTLDVTLQVAFNEVVEVAVATTRIDAGGALSTTTFTGRALEALPDDPGAMMRHLQDLAGVVGDASQLLISVDGFAQSLRLPPKQAIQLIRVSSNPFAAEFADLGKARIEVVTKPGSSQVHADVRAAFNSAGMNAPNALASDRIDEQSQNLSGYISAPIIPDRLSLVAYAGRWSADRAHVVSATVLDPVNAAPVARTHHVPASNRTGSGWLGADARLGAAHTLAAAATATADEGDNQGLGSGVDLPERAFARRSAAWESRATLTSVLSPRAFHELRAQTTVGRDRLRAATEQPAVIVFDAFSAGGQQNALLHDRREVKFFIAERLTVASRTHTIKAGLDLERQRHTIRDRSNFAGTFLFGADVERDANGGVLRDAAGDIIPIAPLENYRRTLLGVPGYRPSQFTIAQGTEALHARQWHYAAFAQDDWTVHPRLTMSYGARHEAQTGVNDASVGARGAAAWAADVARRNVVRVGAGMFFQRVPMQLALDTVRYADGFQRLLVIERPDFFPGVPSEFAGAEQAQTTTYVQSPAMNRPRVLRLAASLERQLPANGLLTLTYDSQWGGDLLRTIDVNVPDGGVRRDATRGAVLQYDSTGRSRRHEIAAAWRSDPTRSVTMFTTYTYLIARRDTDGPGTLPADSARLDAEFGTASDSPTHFGRGGLSFSTLGRVQVSAFISAVSGRAYNITTGLDTNQDGLFTERPRFASPDAAGAVLTPYGWLAVAGTGETIPRNLGREPTHTRVDLHLIRTFRMSDKSSFQIGADVDNLLNNALYSGINGVLTSPAFGTPNVAVTPRRVLVSSGFNF